MNTSVHNSLRRQEGFSLIEVTMALAVFTITSLSASFALLSSMDHREQTFDRYEALIAAREKIAEIQEAANEDDSLIAKTGVSSVYSRFHGEVTAASTLTNGTVTVKCYANETSVPTTLGGPQDLNFDKDSLDALDNQSAGTDLKIVPMEVTVTFDEAGRKSSITLYRLITKTAD